MAGKGKANQESAGQFGNIGSGTNISWTSSGAPNYDFGPTSGGGGGTYTQTSSGNGGGGGGGGGGSNAADEAAAAAAREAALNEAKYKEKDRQIAEDTMKAQRERPQQQAGKAASFGDSWAKFVQDFSKSSSPETSKPNITESTRMIPRPAASASTAAETTSNNAAAKPADNQLSQQAAKPATAPKQVKKGAKPRSAKRAANLKQKASERISGDDHISQDLAGLLTGGGRKVGTAEKDTSPVTPHSSGEEGKKWKRKDVGATEGKQGKKWKRKDVGATEHAETESTLFNEELFNTYSDSRKNDEQGEERERDNRTLDEKMQDMFYQLSRDRIDRALRHNDYVTSRADRMSETDPDLDLEAYFDEHRDLEAWDDALIPLMQEKYRTHGDPRYESTGIGTKIKDNAKWDQYADDLARDFKVGFFPVESQHIEYTDEDEEMPAWTSERVQNIQRDIIDYCGMHDDIDGQRNVFRCIRFYASMSMDSNGKMFNQNEDKWKLSVEEYEKVGRLVLRSFELGMPFAMPIRIGAGRQQLRGTDIVPSGVMPMVLARALTGPNSKLCNPDGSKMSTSDLVQSVQNEWNVYTRPFMEANFVDKQRTRKRKKGEEEDTGPSLVAQRRVIEKMQWALSRLDGMSIEDLSRRYGVDASYHYRLDEIEDKNVEYVEAMRGRYDADAVADHMNETLDQYRHEAKLMNGSIKHQGIPFINRHEVTVDGVGKRTISPFEGVNMFISCLAKTNSLISRPIVALASIPEHGIGNLRTYLALKVGRIGRENQVSDELRNRLKERDALVAFDALKLLTDVGGHGATRLFRETRQPLTQENAIRFLREEYLRDQDDPRVAAGIMWLNKLTRNFVAGDLVFKKSDIMNWLDALCLANECEYHGQIERDLDLPGRYERENNPGSIPLTGAEIEDIFKAHNGDVAGFLAEMAGTDSGVTAFNLMRANSVAQVNPLSNSVNQFLRSHHVTDAMITLFVDTFPTYGINFIYNLVPFSRTLSYIWVKKQQSEGDLTAGDLAIGGNLTGFWEGLRLNLIMDAFSIGHSLLLGGIIGLVFLALGFDPPDDEQNKRNSSMYKIGSKIGLGEDYDGDGKGDGVEMQLAWWLNDVSLLGFPFAYLMATGLRTGDWDLAREVMMDSLYDQVDGNVILDFADIISNWQQDLFEFEQMSRDPSFLGETTRGTRVAMHLYSDLMRAGNKLTPLAPFWDSLSRSALFRGSDARMSDPSKVFDKSTSWKEQQGVTKYVPTYREYINRKFATGNWLYAAVFDALNHTSAEPEKKTGYFWWEQPVRTMQDPWTMVWANKYHFEYDEKPADMTDAEYDAYIADIVMNDINGTFGGNVQEALRYGYFIPHDARKATMKHLYRELNELDNEWTERTSSGWMPDYYKQKNDYYNNRDKINTIIYDWLRNDDIPEWREGYELLLTDYDVTYRYRDTQQPALFGAFERFVNPNVEAVYLPKGNHPTSLLPWTVVDQTDNLTRRGFNAETIPYWYNENLTDLDKVRQMLTTPDGQDVTIKSGRDAGKSAIQTIFGGQLDGSLKSPDEPTINYRAYVPRETVLSDDIINMKQEDSDNYNQAAQDAIKNRSSSSGGSGGSGGNGGGRGYSRRYYGGGSYRRGGGGGGGGGGYNYNPKIYSHPESINADRAANMYTKQPYTAATSYLKPSFSTKGSREAYKRQDL